MDAHDAALRPLQLHDVEIAAQRGQPIRRAASTDVLDLARAATVVFDALAEIDFNLFFRNVDRPNRLPRAGALLSNANLCRAH